MPVSISVPTLLIELAIFLATVWMMEALVFNPVRRAWAERDRAIQEGLAAAGSSRDEAAEARAEVENILREARRRSQAEIDDAAAQAGRLRDELVARATEEFRRLVDEARQSIAEERERSAAELRERVVDLALLAASRVTGRSYNEPEARELAAAVVEQEGLR